MNTPMTNVKKTVTATTETISETAKKLHEDMQQRGYYQADRMREVFGDPRRGVEVKTSAEECLSFSHRRK